MNAQNYIDSLFAAYEETAALADFKEELRSNMNDRISSYLKKGMDEEAAFKKAIGELGDISLLADDLSLKKKQEVFEDMYMKTRNYMSSLRVLLFVIFGAIAAFGMIVSLVTWYVSGNILGSLGAFLPFGMVPVMGFTFLILTQETAGKYPMKGKRAALYTLAVSVLSFGIFVFALTFFSSRASLYAALSTLIPFVLPGMAFMAFLLMTEKDRSKPWLLAQQSAAMKQAMRTYADPAVATRHGLLSGALWIFSFAIFIGLTLTVGIKLSWLTLLFAVGMQVLIEFAYNKRPRT